MDPSAALRSYLTAFFASAAIAVLAAAALNLAVDPYGMFGTPRIPGFNALKPSAPDRIGVAKPYYAERVAARTVIAGNSRPEAGLDPASRCWSPSQSPVFNTAVPGASFPDQLRYLEHASARGEVRQVLIGLDLFDFLGRRSGAPDYARWPGPPTDLDRRLSARLDGSPSPGYTFRKWQGWLTAVFSLETLADSVMTPIRQDDPHASTRRADGFNPAMDYLAIVRAEGQAVLFEQKRREIVARLQRPDQSIFDDNRDWSWDFETLTRYLGRARGQGIVVKLFVNPYHAEYLTAIALTGHWPQLESWKRTLTRISDGEGVVLWDFNAFDPTTEESVPPPGDRTRVLRWFWEPAHYRSEYGERMLSAMLERDCAPGAPSAGSRLVPAGLETHLAGLRQGLRAFVETHPESVARLGLDPAQHNIK